MAEGGSISPKHEVHFLLAREVGRQMIRKHEGRDSGSAG